MEHILDHTKSNDFMDTSSNYFDTISGMDYLQYPHSPNFGVGMTRKCRLLFRADRSCPSKLTQPPTVPPTSSPRIGGFNSLNLNNGMSEYTYSSTPNYTTSSPTRPFTPTGSIYPGALSNLGWSLVVFLFTTQRLYTQEVHLIHYEDLISSYHLACSLPDVGLRRPYY